MFDQGRAPLCNKAYFLSQKIGSSILCVNFKFYSSVLVLVFFIKNEDINVIELVFFYGLFMKVDKLYDVVFNKHSKMINTDTQETLKHREAQEENCVCLINNRMYKHTNQTCFFRVMRMGWEGC